MLAFVFVQNQLTRMIHAFVHTSQTCFVQKESRQVARVCLRQKAKDYQSKAMRGFSVTSHDLKNRQEVPLDILEF